MFDSYFCRKFHEKEISLDMIIDKIGESGILREVFVISVLFLVAFGVVLCAERPSYIITICASGSAGIISGHISRWLASRTVVATCPLTKSN